MTRDLMHVLSQHKRTRSAKAVSGLENPNSVGEPEGKATGSYRHTATLREPSIDWTINHGPGSDLNMAAKTPAKSTGRITTADRIAARRLMGRLPK